MAFRWLVVWPLVVIAALSCAVALSGRVESAIAVIAGGGISMLPSSVAAYRFRVWRQTRRALTLGRMLAWEAGKWLATAVLFTAVFIGYQQIGHGDIPALWLFGGFIAAQLAHMVALTRMGKPGHGADQF